MKILSFAPALFLVFSAAAMAAENTPAMTTETTASETTETTTQTTEDTMAAKETAAKETAAQYSADNIARSAFTSGVENREPIDKVGQLTNDKEKIYFFTEIKGMAGKTVTHRWEHAGNIKAEVSFNIGSDRWRVWSSKNLQPSWVGEWIVSVVDENGNTLKEESMAYVPAAEAPTEKSSTPESVPETPAATDPVEAPAVN